MRLHSGFTLIEVLIALFIMVLLAGWAVQSYQHAVVKGKRAEGRAALMTLMQQQERYYSVHTRYLAFSSDEQEGQVHGMLWFSGSSSLTSSYEINAQACDEDGIGHCIRLIALPGTVRVNANYRDSRCGILSINSRGEKTADADDCW
ncbi:pilus assembly protein PilE [Herminiimonas sp. KBW02]|uniref:type IV pilin protein n=1 Tax=Herminiimonas sp. KBW02 TaxID=2153363 RepID=UPI000F595891|nr:type IV pilin protein [Herminiimonas sp. KBW02]RQO33542.1 pilus assembly protein PilE [Herminiimonas sp. KBW02]